MTARLTGLSPIARGSPRVLVLGSMPGATSLARKRYYVGRGNRFWPLMAELVGFESDLPYAEGVQAITRSGVALWDVLGRCERSGSLDARIVRATEEPNDIEGFLARHPDIGLIALNGRRAAASFARHFSAAALPRSVALPSTSAANTRTPFARLVDEWGFIRLWLLPEGRGAPGHDV